MAKAVGDSGSTLREAQKQLTLEKLIDAARGVFHAKGYNAATIDDIVDSAGASRGTAHYALAYPAGRPLTASRTSVGSNSRRGAKSACRALTP